MREGGKRDRGERDRERDRERDSERGGGVRGGVRALEMSAELCLPVVQN